MAEWKLFNPDEKSFNNKKDYEEYRENTRCGVCHKKLEIGDEWDFRPIQTTEQAGGLTVQAIIIHKECVDDEIPQDKN